MYYKNHIIKKKLGQVFIKDSNIINMIMNSFKPEKKQTIIEIGPGLGALTKKILNIINSLILIELDTNLVNHLIKLFNGKNLKIYNQDIMTINFFDLYRQNQKQKIRLIGNLPYNIATKLIIYLFKYINIIHDMHFMLQKEVAERIVANPNNKKYGRISIISQYHCKIAPLFEVPAISFFPIPKIKSMFIQLLPYTNNKPYPPINTQYLSIITQLAFGQRRKTINNSLSTLFNSEEIKKAGLNLQSRAENITIQQYCLLTSILCKKTHNLK